MSKVTVIPDSRIETIKLSTTWVARPNGSCGNVGWSPCAWVAGYGKSADAAVRSFYAANTNIAEGRGYGS